MEQEKNEQRLSSYGKGYRYYAEERDLQYSMRLALPYRRPHRPDRYEWEIGEPTDQGTTSACVGHASWNWLRCTPTPTFNGPTPKEIYREAQRRDQWPGENYEGTSIHGAMNYLSELGHVENYLWAWDLDTIRRWVRDRGPVIAGTRWHRSFYEPNEDGVISFWGQADGGHAWLIVGHWESKGLFRAVNSWGTDWGDEGRFWVPESIIERLLTKPGSQFCAAIERPLEELIES